jgi:hypothetical protein
MYVYEVTVGGSLSKGREFAEMPYVPGGPDEGDTFIAHSGAERPIGERGGVPDGLKIDTAGRVFSTGPGGCWVWEPDGEFLGVIETPELPANVGWLGGRFQDPLPDMPHLGLLVAGQDTGHAYSGDAGSNQVNRKVFHAVGS